MSEAVEKIHSRLDTGELEKAEGICSELRATEDRIECHNVLGWARYRQSEDELAARHFEGFAILGSPTGHFGLGCINYSKLDDRLALRNFEQARAGHYPMASFWIGRIYQRGIAVPTNLRTARDFYFESSAEGYFLARRAVTAIDFKVGGLGAKTICGLRLLSLFLQIFIVAFRDREDWRLSDMKSTW